MQGEVVVRRCAERAPGRARVEAVLGLELLRGLLGVQVRLGPGAVAGGR